MNKEELEYELGERIVEKALIDSNLLYAALVKIFQRLPTVDAEILLEERQVRFVCPRANVAAEIGIIPDPEKGLSTFWLLCLESKTLDYPYDELVYVITHELAHAFLEHSVGPVNQEIEADQQVIKWGFEKELRKTSFNYLYGTGRDSIKERKEMMDFFNERLKE